MANYAPVPDTYKGKKTATMSRAEYEKMLKELGYDKPSKEKHGYMGEEPDTAKPTKKMAKGGAVNGFKACANCPSPAKCKAAGKCMMEGKKKKMAGGGLLVIPVKMEKTTATKYAGATSKKKPAVKAKKAGK